MNDELQRLALELADECARSDIETHCPRDSNRWCDTSPKNSTDAERVARALRYLDLRAKTPGYPLPYIVERWMCTIRFRSKD